ncbi:Na+/Pi symporter [Cyanidiococcus yangmingshanensis]|uniref:Na+/Pi symporter n=1 Tax=Cyanidiococcus yangmingshanensis TaxID=2690220 RepID=A0A7J7IQL5_9RHOD|nr:Na+/Pi symporter [Cyanidiococcus yangmingshanensis]
MPDLNPTLLAVIGVGLAICVLCVMGANDVANVLGTAYGAGALRAPAHSSSSLSVWARIKGAVPLVLFAGVFEFAGALFAGSSVTEHISEQLVTGGTARQRAVSALGTLVASFALVAGSTVAALPVSASHATASAIVAAGAFQAWQQGRDTNTTSSVAAGEIALPIQVRWSSVVPIVIVWLASPIVGFLAGYVLYFICGAQCIFEEPLGLPLLAGSIMGSLFVFIFIAGPPDLRVLLGRWSAPVTAAISSLVFTASMVMFLIKRREMLARYSDAPFVPASPSATTIDAEAPSIDPIHETAYLEPPYRYARGLRLLMIFTAAAIAFAHGGNGKFIAQEENPEFGTRD